MRHSRPHPNAAGASTWDQLQRKIAELKRMLAAFEAGTPGLSPDNPLVAPASGDEIYFDVPLTLELVDVPPGTKITAQPFKGPNNESWSQITVPPPDVL